MNLHHGGNLSKWLYANFIYFFLSIYVLLNIITLLYYPPVHSDESWLSGLSRAWLNQRAITVTEPFFDLYPRAPHAIKILYHGAQAIVFAVGGYGIFQTRLLSLGLGVAALLAFRRLLLRILPAKRRDMLAGLFTMLVAIDPQFMLAAHLGRQEIALVLMMVLAALQLFPKGGEQVGFAGGLRAGLFVAIAIGIHPAAFLVAAVLTGMLLTLPHRLETFSGFFIACTLGALLFIGLSLWMNPAFFHDYIAFGDSVEVGVPWFIKLVRFPAWYQKLWYRYSGTYWLPELRPLLPLYGLSLAASLALAIAEAERRLLVPFFALAGFNVALVVLGKFGPPLLVLEIPLCYLALALVYVHGSQRLPPGAVPWVAALLIALVAGTTAYNVADAIRTSPERYTDYQRNITTALAAEETVLKAEGAHLRVLGNLNTEYALPYGALLDFRNLAYLKSAGLDFASYIRTRHITHILYPEEMDVIYRERPVWNILYGNVAAYYDDMQRFLAEDCVAVASFEAPVYGMRIVSYSGKHPWKVTLYRVRRSRIDLTTDTASGVSVSRSDPP